MSMIIAAHEPERTAWFDAATVPPLAGVYERLAPAGPYACWDGKGWRADARTPAAAALRVESTAIEQAPWRGLVTAPPAPCATCRGQSVLDRGVDIDGGADLIEECPDC